MLLEHIHTIHTFPAHTELMAGFIVLAIAQLLVQLFFFLHLGRGQNKHWSAAILGFALFVIAVVVGGTLWIMSNLQNNMTNVLQGGTFINGQVNVVNEND